MFRSIESVYKANRALLAVGKVVIKRERNDIDCTLI